MLYLFDRFSHHPEFSKNPSLRAALLDAMYFCLMIGVGESLLPSFGVAIGGSAWQIGVLSCLPALIGAFSQTLGVRLYMMGLPRKNIIVTGAMLQGFSWFLLAFLAFSQPGNYYAVWILVLLAVIYTASGALTAPVWTSLIGDLVPPENRGEYFGFRNQRSGWITIFSLLLGGLFLNSAKYWQWELIAFGVLFLIAGLARIASAIWLSRYQDPGHNFNIKVHFTFWDFIKRLPTSNFTKFVFFYALLNGCASFSGAFVAVYALRDLGFSYASFSFLMTVQMAVQFFFMKNWGKISDTYGNLKILTFCGWGVSISGLWWAISDNFLFLICAQIYAGIVWSGFSLAGSNFLFDAVSPAKRAQCTAYMSIINTSIVLLGTMLGALTVTYLPSDFLFAKGLFTKESAYIKIFVFSTLLRLIVVSSLLHKFKEVKEVKDISNKELLFTILNRNPFTSLLFGSIGYAIKKKKMTMSFGIQLTCFLKYVH